MVIKKCFDDLKKIIKEDNSYAWSWHCNIAMAFQDEGGSHEIANKAAARFMQSTFDVDITKFKEWKSFSWSKNE
jgi:hypothetical protein